MLDDVLGITADLGRTAGPEPEKRRKRKFGRTVEPSGAMLTITEGECWMMCSV